MRFVYNLYKYVEKGNFTKLSRETLIKMAKNFIDQGFYEESLKDHANQYIAYKFNQSITFAKITEIHFDIFREKKHPLHKIKAMTIIELIILASDILDDIQDKDAQDVPWRTVDDALNLNIVVGTLTICMKESDGMAEEDESKWIQEKISDLILLSISGQQIDLNNTLSDENDYLQMCHMKSASLIRLACLLGAGKVDEEMSKNIEEYSNYLGVIFQLRNDVADVIAGFRKSDIVSKKRTLPILYYLNTKNEAYTSIQDYYLNPSSTLDAEIIHQELIKGDALLYCSIVEEVYVHRLKVCLNNLTIEHDLKQLFINSINKLLTD